MTSGDGDLGGAIVAAVAVIVIAVVVLGVGLWLGKVAIAPRIIRRQDRAEQEREEPGDRPD